MHRLGLFKKILKRGPENTSRDVSPMSPVAGTGGNITNNKQQQAISSATGGTNNLLPNESQTATAAPLTTMMILNNETAQCSNSGGAGGGVGTATEQQQPVSNNILLPHAAAITTTSSAANSFRAVTTSTQKSAVIIGPKPSPLVPAPYLSPPAYQQFGTTRQTASAASAQRWPSNTTTTTSKQVAPGQTVADPKIAGFYSSSSLTRQQQPVESMGGKQSSKSSSPLPCTLSSSRGLVREASPQSPEKMATTPQQQTASASTSASLRVSPQHLVAAATTAQLSSKQCSDDVGSPVNLCGTARNNPPATLRGSASHAITARILLQSSFGNPAGNESNEQTTVLSTTRRNLDATSSNSSSAAMRMSSNNSASLWLGPSPASSLNRHQLAASAPTAALALPKSCSNIESSELQTQQQLVQPSSPAPVYLKPLKTINVPSDVTTMPPSGQLNFINTDVFEGRMANYRESQGTFNLTSPPYDEEIENVRLSSEGDEPNQEPPPAQQFSKPLMSGEVMIVTATSPVSSPKRPPMGSPVGGSHIGPSMTVPPQGPQLVPSLLGHQVVNTTAVAGGSAPSSPMNIQRNSPTGFSKAYSNERSNLQAVLLQPQQEAPGSSWRTKWNYETTKGHLFGETTTPESASWKQQQQQQQRQQEQQHSAKYAAVVKPVGMVVGVTSTAATVRGDGNGIHSGKYGGGGGRLDNYDIGRTIGTGSFGRVFLARRKESKVGASTAVAIKRLTKSVVLSQKQVDHIISEKAILEIINHPFLVRLQETFKDERYLYIVLEYVEGGEFFTFLRRNKRLDNDSSRFYAAEAAEIFDYLHNLNIVYRDLKPENLLIARDGYLKLTDFGFAKVVEHRTFTLCGTPEYIAPEVLLNKGHGKPADWWGLGILIYEMIMGYPPFFDEDTLGIYQKIIAGKILFPKFFDKNAKSLVKHLLTHDVARRYGNLRNGVLDVKEHRWFQGFDWEALVRKQLTPPYKPHLRSNEDASNFEIYSESTETAPPVTGSDDPFVNW